jgi:hypothetical protein
LQLPQFPSAVGTPCDAPQPMICKYFFSINNLISQTAK